MFLNKGSASWAVHVQIDTDIAVIAARVFGILNSRYCFYNSQFFDAKIGVNFKNGAAARGTWMKMPTLPLCGKSVPAACCLTSSGSRAWFVHIYKLRTLTDQQPWHWLSAMRQPPQVLIRLPVLPRPPFPSWGMAIRAHSGCLPIRLLSGRHSGCITKQQV